MNKKIRSILLLAIVAVFCVGVFSACKPAEKIDIFQYSSDNLNVIGKLIMIMHGWIGNYGWTVVVFTVFLKILMLPLDFWQRYSARKSSVKMQRMQPLLEGIDKRFGANTQRANEEKQKLYKKYGTGMLGSCLPMIVSMIIFFVMFGGLNAYSRYCNLESFRTLADTYYETYINELSKNDEIKVIVEEARDRSLEAYVANHPNASEVAKNIVGNLNGVDAANKYTEACAEAEQAAINAVKQKYRDTRESWLWIQSVWQPDTWETIMPAYNSNTNGFSSIIEMKDFRNGEKVYDKIWHAVLETGDRGTEGKWNGLMILPILSVGLSFLSMFISQLMEKKNRKGEETKVNAQQAATNKVMMIIMPLMMAVFGFIYTGAFAIYMVTNYTISILSTIALRIPVEKLVERNIAKTDEKENTGKASYMR